MPKLRVPDYPNGMFDAGLLLRRYFGLFCDAGFACWQFQIDPVRYLFGVAAFHFMDGSCNFLVFKRDPGSYVGIFDHDILLADCAIGIVAKV